MDRLPFPAMTIGFVHACEQNHLNLSIVGGGRVAQLTSRKAVTSPVDPLRVYDYALGIRRPVAMDAVADPFRASGRDYVHVMASPSSRAGLPDQLARRGLRLPGGVGRWR